MSTDLQKYSTENQLETIRRYAAQRDFKIVRTFEDSGRSGLTINNRDGLQSLMHEVESGTANFQAILVYDVSRWGRFQDADEGAYRSPFSIRWQLKHHFGRQHEQIKNKGHEASKKHPD
jgi:DNA invertase Pin-like site-specific DNA recombinase